MSRRQSGFTLLEVLVAIVIISLGMLGVAALLITVHKANASSYLQQQAVQDAYDVLDRMRANLAGTQAGYYDGTYTTGVTTGCLGTTVQTPQQIATCDTSQWGNTLQQLPAGKGKIVTSTANNQTTVTVTVSWSDAPAQDAIEKGSLPAGTSTVLVGYSRYAGGLSTYQLTTVM
jgi:type IV pilus assembly protein PilV